MKNKKNHLDKCSVLSGTQKDECTHFPKPHHTPTWTKSVNGEATRTLEEVAVYAGPNDAFIVRAVNCHEELVKELKKAADMCRYDNVEKTVELWDALIAKAEGK